MGRKPKEEKNVTIPREELLQYIKDHCEYFTCTEMAADTGYNHTTIKYIADQAGIKIITQGERIREYIRCNMHLTLEVQAEKLDLDIANLRYYYKQFGFNLKSAGKGQKIIPEDERTRKRKLEELWKSGEIPLDVLLGPIARSYHLEVNTLDTINSVRMRVLGS